MSGSGCTKKKTKKEIKIRKINLPRARETSDVSRALVMSPNDGINLRLGLFSFVPVVLGNVGNRRGNLAPPLGPFSCSWYKVIVSR